MKRKIIILCLILVVAMLSSCSSCAPETPLKEPDDNSKDSSNGVNNGINDNIVSSQPPYNAYYPNSLKDLEAWVIENNKYIFPNDIDGYYAFDTFMWVWQKKHPENFDGYYDYGYETAVDIKYCEWLIDNNKWNYDESFEKNIRNIHYWFEYVQTCYPDDYHNMVEEYYETQTNRYGDIEYHIGEISKRGYLTFSDPDNIVEWYSCTLYDVNSSSLADMMICYSYETEDVRVNLPCNVMYIPEEYMEMAKSSPIECIKALRKMELYDRESPELTYNGKRYFNRTGYVNIGGRLYSAIFGEYLDAEGNRDVSSGNIFFIYEDVIIHINRSYSNPDVRYVLSKVEISMTVPTKE